MEGSLFGDFYFGGVESEGGVFDSRAEAKFGGGRRD